MQLIEFDLTQKQWDELMGKGWKAADDFLKNRQHSTEYKKPQ